MKESKENIRNLTGKRDSWRRSLSNDLRHKLQVSTLSRQPVSRCLSSVSVDALALSMEALKPEVQIFEFM